MKLGSVIIFAKDILAVTAFYRDVIGLRPEKEQPLPASRFFRFRTGHCRLCLHRSSKPNGGRQKIVFHVDSVKVVHDHLKSNGMRLRPLKNGAVWSASTSPTLKAIGFSSGEPTSQASTESRRDLPTVCGGNPVSVEWA